MRMTFDEFCNTFSNIKYLGYDIFLDEYEYYFQVDDSRNNYRKLVYCFKYETKQYNSLYDDYEPYNGNEGVVERYRLKDYTSDGSGYDYREFKNITKEFNIIVCDDYGNRLQVENLQNNKIFYVNGDPFTLTNGRVKRYIIGLASDYFKKRTIPDNILNNLK